MYQMLTPDFAFQDYRGKLVQLADSGYVQVNVIMTKQGVIRGNHYHKRCKEAFYIVTGSVDVVLSRDSDRTEVHFSSGEFFEIEPFTVHSMSYPEDCIMVALYDQPVEIGHKKDIFSVEDGA